jgi:two-component system sensor histidine kinase FlrB
MAVAFSHSSASSEMSSPVHRVKDSLFHQAKFAFTQQAFSAGDTLEKESYRGELALLRQQSNQLEQVIDVMPTGMIMLDGDGIVIKINKVASSLLDEPILGQAWFDVIKRSFKPRADDWHEVSLKDGRRVKLEITALGEQPGQLIMITDLTETRLLQDKLGHMQRLSSLGRLVSKLAHQIRTPLSAAMLYGANLKNKKLSMTDRNSFQTKLMSRLHDLEQQVNDMLLFSKSGKQQVVEPLSLNELITDSVSALEALVEQAKAKVIIKLCQDDCQILGNKRALNGAIENLIHNSLQVIKQNAEITITTHCQNEYAYISVQDNGQGIDSELANKIFEPFYTSRAQGTGLGLAVVKSVAKAHQGDVRLVSQPGEGAHFCIHLPILERNQVNEENTNEPK